MPEWSQFHIKLAKFNKRVGPERATQYGRGVVTGVRQMISAIKLGLVALVLFALAYAVETRAILHLESSGSGAQGYEYAP
jgi:hypothetical protein